MRPPTETTPDLELTPADIREILAELEQYRGLYHDLFYRCEQREQAAYLSHRKRHLKRRQ